METFGSLSVRRVVKPGVAPADPTGAGKRPLVLVLCHGFGAPGDDLVGLAGALDVPPGTVMLFPEAPLDLSGHVSVLSGGSRAWWLIDMAALERAIARRQSRDLASQVPEGLAEARAALSELLDEVAAREPGVRIVLGGFSQGAMLALDVALRDPTRALAGVVLLSGTLLAEREWTPLMAGRRATPVFQSHGETDPILPFAAAERLRDALTAAGVEVTFDAFAGPHTILPRTLERLGGWLAALP